MSELGQNDDQSAKPHKRLAIFETVAGQVAPLGRLTISKADGDAANVKLEGATDEVLQKIKYLITPEVMKGKVSGKESLEKILADFKIMIEAEGYQTEELPDGDYQMQFTVNMNTGKMIGTQKAMHAYAGGADDLISQIMKLISEQFESVPAEVAKAIRKFATAGDPAKAFDELKSAVDEGKLGFAPNAALLHAVDLINLDTQNDESRALVRDVLVRTALQLKQPVFAAKHAEMILAERPGLTDIQKTDLEMIIAHAAAHEGNIETAMTIWRRLLKTPEKMNPESRGWALRNISLTLDIQTPEALDTARRSADAFLEAGDKAEAGRSLMRVSKALLYGNPQEAIDTLTEIEALASQEGLVEKEMLSALHHARANRLSALGNHETALADAVHAVELKRGVVGLESELISSLYLAAQEQKFLGRDEEAKAYTDEALQLTDATDDPHFLLANRITALIANYDQTEAEGILETAKATNNNEAISAVETLIATLTPGLTDTQRLSKLEECLRGQDQMGLPEGAKAPARQALATQLIKLGELDRAEPWLRKLLAANPIDRWARDSLVNTLWAQDKWGDAAIFLRKQIEAAGELPGLNWALGKSLLKAGALDDAISVLHKTIGMATNDANLRQAVQALRDEALDMGGTLRPPQDEPPESSAITTLMLEEALREFGRFITADKRMTFWTMGAKDYEWIPKPEAYAQNLLHTYLKGKFDERINIFEEIKTGAGRIDIYVQLGGGLSVVIELKMCGVGYSSSYAASGEEQILHYLENRRTNLGYLVVLDARYNDNGRAIMPVRPSDKFTVKEIVCDVRPRFKKGTKS